MASTSIKAFKWTLVGRSARSPLPGTLLTSWHFGQVIVSRPWLGLCQCFKHCRQKLWRHGRCFGFCVYVSAHWTRNFFTKIVRQRCDIHGSSVFLRRQREFRNLTQNNEVLWLCFIFQSFFGILLWLSFELHQLIRDPCLEMKSHPHVVRTTHMQN